MLRSELRGGGEFEQVRGTRSLCQAAIELTAFLQQSLSELAEPLCDFAAVEILRAAADGHGAGKGMDRNIHRLTLLELEVFHDLHWKSHRERLSDLNELPFHVYIKY